MNPETIQQLKDELKQEMRERLKDAKFEELLGKYGISSDNALKFQCIIDLTQIHPATFLENKELKGDLQATPDQEIVQLDCIWCACCGCCN